MTDFDYDNFINYLGRVHPDQLMILKFSLVNGKIKMKLRSRFKVAEEQYYQSCLMILQKWMEHNKLSEK